MAKTKTTTKLVKKKRAYKKKTDMPPEVRERLFEDIHETFNKQQPIKQYNQYADIDCLAIFCNNFDKLDYESQVRVFAYITSRYSHLQTSQKID